MITVAPIAVAAVLGYGALMALAHRRGRGWRAWRALCWAAGVTVAAMAALGPVADHMDFRAHMIGHVLLGMLAPLLLVLAAPVTLALRALPVAAARRISTVLRSRAVAAATHPVVTAVLTVGGLWVLYRTGLYAASMRHPTVLLLVHVHVFLAGWLFTHSLVGPDPAPHRAGLPVRAAVLVLAVAAHDVLAKTLYARPPAGVDPGGAAVGAQVMYYGGAPVEIALFVLLGAEWFRRQGLTDQHRPLTGRRCPPPRPASGSPAKYWSPGPPPSSRTPRRSSRAAPTQA
jgi:putative membrane protein